MNYVLTVCKIRFPYISWGYSNDFYGIISIDPNEEGVFPTKSKDKLIKVMPCVNIVNFNETEIDKANGSTSFSNKADRGYYYFIKTVLLIKNLCMIYI